MSSFYQDIYNWLQTYPDLVTLFSTRMYPVRLPDSATFPCLVIRRITNPKRYTLDGESNLKEQFYQFTVWDESVKDASEAADTFEQTITGYRGIVGESMAGSVFIQNRIDKPDPDTSLESQVIDVKFSLQ